MGRAHRGRGGRQPSSGRGGPSPRPGWGGGKGCAGSAGPRGPCGTVWEKGKGGVGFWGAEQGSDLDLGHFKLETGRPGGDIRWALKRPRRRVLIVRAGIHLASAFPPFPEQAVPHGAPSDEGGGKCLLSPQPLSSHSNAKSRTPCFC